MHGRRAVRRWLSLWPPVGPAALLRRPALDPPFPLAEPRLRLYGKARQGLFDGARALGLGAGDAVLAPAYHHGSEIESLTRTGAKVLLYGNGEDLEPDPAELESLMTPEVRALYLIHYLGFPQDVARWRGWCDDRGLLLFEDAAQAWLSAQNGHSAGSLGDLSIFCLYKTAGLNQPGALLCSTPPAQPGGNRVPVGPALARSQIAWLSQRLDVPGLVGRRAYQTASPDPDTDSEFDLTEPSLPSRVSVAVMRRLRGADTLERRRSNYTVLLEQLAEHVPAPFRSLPAGASPLHLPVWATNRRVFLERLAARGVEGGEAWPLRHPLVPRGRFPWVDAWREAVVWLPVHQGLREADLELIATAARTAL
jgi:dTDP-4-amino-4,6-dideoxygalactose transaminase